ncbi:MAG: GNAT family N-acetyltransferase [Clostridiales bacterium]|nr:GNAT family N-acetyltransferase [Clostridiales bacterium]
MKALAEPPETARLCLRPFRATDLSDLHAILGDPEVMRYAEPPYSMEQTEAFLNTFCIQQRRAVAAVCKKSGIVIGYILFSPLKQPGVWEMGWFFRRSYWRQGLAFEGCSALIRYAFDQLGAQHIVAETADPIRSVGLMKKLGMTCRGQERGLLLYQIDRPGQVN